MTYQTLAEANATTLAKVFIYVSNNSPLFIPALLGFFFGIVMLGSYFSQIRTRGQGDFWGCFAVASFCSFVLSLVLSWIPNLIPIYYVIVTLILSFVSVGILLTQNRDNF